MFEYPFCKGDSPEETERRILNNRIRLIDLSSCNNDYPKPSATCQSLYWRSPEVVLQLPYDTKIDVWSLGVVLLELFLGYTAFPGQNEFELLHLVHRRVVTPLPSTSPPGLHFAEHGHAFHAPDRVLPPRCRLFPRFPSLLGKPTVPTPTPVSRAVRHPPRRQGDAVPRGARQAVSAEHARGTVPDRVARTRPLLRAVNANGLCRSCGPRARRNAPHLPLHHGRRWLADLRHRARTTSRLWCSGVSRRRGAEAGESRVGAFRICGRDGLSPFLRCVRA